MQMILHAHALFLALVCIVLTFVGFRSSYIFMISLFFYGVALILNLLTTLHQRGIVAIKNYFLTHCNTYYLYISEKLWSVLIVLSQIMPFLYMAYIFFALSSTLMPMMGRFGTGLNPDLLIGGLCALGTILAMGFVVSVYNNFECFEVILK